MNFVETRPRFESTSAGSMLVRPLRGPVLVGVMLAGLGTSAESAPPGDTVSRSTRPAQQTTSGMPVVLMDRARAAIAEMRRLSGLTWEQLARLFKVSRRSLHFWASGKAMTPANEEHLQRVVAVLRKIDRGSAAASRAALLAVRDDGVIPFDLLAERRYDAAAAILGHGPGTASAVPSALRNSARLARAPRSPEELVGALQDRVHRETGTVRGAKSVRIRSGR